MTVFAASAAGSFGLAAALLCEAIRPGEDERG
jgi:hypothetical protein